MAEPFKLRLVNSVVGVFVLGALALVLAGIAAAGRSRHWFEGSVTLQARFPAEALESLSAGAPVILSQERVGEVLDLAPGPDGARARFRLHRSASRCAPTPAPSCRSPWAACWASRPWSCGGGSRSGLSPRARSGRAAAAPS